MMDYGVQAPTKEYFDKKGRLHRVDGPASVNKHGDEAWLINGRYHRDNGPALTIISQYYGFSRVEWFKNGQIHRVGGPAVIEHDGTKWWYQNDRPHRIDGPAFIPADSEKTIEFWYRGRRVRNNVDWEFLTDRSEEEVLAFILKWGNIK